MSKSEPIFYYNRYTKSMEHESIFGEKWLRWAYENPLGLLSTKALISRKLVSSWYGRRMKRSQSKERVKPFIENYGVDTSEFLKDPADFDSFNDFFIRRLKPECRPVSEINRHVVFPADGRHLVFPRLDEVDQVFVKGQRWQLTELLKKKEWIDCFRGGSLVLSRLCPLDYHHFHFPIAGIPAKAETIKGPLFSVNPIALRKNLSFIMGNKRMVTPMRETLAGSVIIIEVGATMVGTIRQSFEPDRPVLKGVPKGYFEFGGSSVITLFQRDRIKFADDLIRHSAEGIELYAKMGDFMGEISS